MVVKKHEIDCLSKASEDMYEIKKRKELKRNDYLRYADYRPFDSN